MTRLSHDRTLFATANPAAKQAYPRFIAEPVIAAPAPSKIACVAIVMMAEPIITPASQLPPVSGGGLPSVIFSRCMWDTPRSIDLMSGQVAQSPHLT
jgi:hypothetical protein